jgi:serine/threonine protein kinase
MHWCSTGDSSSSNDLPELPSTIPDHNCTEINCLFKTKNSTLYTVTHLELSRVLKAYVCQDDAEREGAALRALSGTSGVIRCHAAFDFGEIPCLVLDFCSGGDLYSYFLTKATPFSKPKIPPEESQVIAWALREALEGVHVAGFVHCDVKLDNTLISNKPDLQSVVLADFGLARRIPDDGTRLKGQPGTLTYQAPELFYSSDAEFSTPVDIWAFGILMFILFTGIDHTNDVSFPFDWTQDEIDEQFRADLNDADAPDDAIEAILSMLRVDPAERPTATRLKEMSYFQVAGAPLARTTKSAVQRLAPGVGD